MTDVDMIVLIVFILPIALPLLGVLIGMMKSLESRNKRR